MTNRYPARCAICGARVPAHGGVLERKGRRWVTTHTACARAAAAAVTTATFHGEHGPGPAGRCLDAPCCGCCS